MNKVTFLKSILLLCALVVGSGSVWAEDPDVTISFTSNSKVNTDGSLSESPYDSGNLVVTTAQNGGSQAPQFSSSQLRLYAGEGNGCSVTLTSAEKWISKVVFTFSGASYIAASQGSYTYTSGTTGTWTGLSRTLTLQNTNNSNAQVRITKIEVFYGEAPSVVFPVFTPAGGMIAKGSTVSITSETIGADIYYTINGTTPTSASTKYTEPITINNDIIIKAIAIKGSDESSVTTESYTVFDAVPGLSVDFEYSTVSYVDWVFYNIGIHNATSSFAAHGGTSWGSNVNVSDNGVKTASITTKNKIANPGSFTCYVSKESSNTTASTWKVETSTDGTSWTTVGSYDAKGMNQGEWEEFSVDLTAYTDVYVRLYYEGGGTAKRAVDDITLTEIAPVTITSAEYATYCNATNALDFSTTGITAYTATDAGTSVTLNEITSGKVPANTPVVLYKAEADGTAINVPVIASADAPTGTNDLRVSTGTDVENMFVLSKKSGKVGFYKWAGSSALSAGKVYLQASSSYAPDFLGFDGGTTAVEGVKAVSVESGEYFNLAGQRVAQPTKGLYIVNGKKVVVK